MSDNSSFKIDARDLRALSRVSINLSSFNHLETANPVSVKLTTPFENVSRIVGLENIYKNVIQEINTIVFPGNPINTTQGALRQVVMAFQSTNDRHVYVLSVGNGEILSGQPYDVNGQIDYATRAAMISIASLQQQIRAMDPNANFVVTGGYNGGTVANLYSAITGTPAITFSAVPIDQLLIDAANLFVSPLRTGGSLFSGTSLTLDHSIRWNYSPFDIAGLTSFETLIPTRSTGIADGYDGSSGQSLFNFGANAMPFGKAIVALRFAKRAAAAEEMLKFGIDEALKAGLNEAGPINVNVGTSSIEGLGDFSTPDGVLNIALLSSQGDIDNILFQGDDLLIPFARRELFSNDLIINTLGDPRFNTINGILSGEYNQNNYYWLDYDVSRELSAALANDPTFIDRLIEARQGFNETTSNPVFRSFVLNYSNFGRFNESFLSGILPISLVGKLKSATGNFSDSFSGQFNRVLRTFVSELIKRGAEPQQNDIVNLYEAFVVEFDPTDTNRLSALEAGNLASAVTQKRIVDAAIDTALLREPAGARPNEPTCFPPGTPVLVSDGVVRAIEDLAVGDEILCYDPADPTGALTIGRISGKRTLQASSMLKIDDLVCTPDHELLFEDGAFRSADQAVVGMGLVKSDGRTAYIRSISPSDGGPVFSIAVEPFPTFVASGYRVHNEALCDFSKSIYPVNAELSIRFTQYDDGRIGIEYINSTGKVLREKIIDDKLIVERVWDEYDDFTNTETPDDAGIIKSRLPVDASNQVYKYEVNKYQSIEQFGAVGNSIGSILGSRIAGNDAALGIALGATFGTVLENLFESLRNGGAWGELPLSSLPILDNIGTEFAGNLIGSASSYLLAQIIAAVGVDGIPGEVLQSAAGNVISTIAQNILTNAPNPLADIGPGLANAAGSFVGTKLASTIYTFDSVGGQIGSAIGSAVGSIFAGTVLKALVPKLLQALGGFGGPVGAAVGAFVGYFLGGLIGSLFGGTPRSGADASWDDASKRFVVTNLYSRKGGSKDAAQAAAGSVADMLNAVLDMTGGRLENPSAVQSGNYGMRKQDYVYRPYSTRDKDAITQRFTGAEGMSDLINYGAMQAMSDSQFRLLGGNIYQKRAFYNYIEGLAGDYTKLDVSVLTGSFSTASSLQNYLYNFDLSNRVASADADTVFAAELAFTLTHAQELGLRRRGASDWFGGWEYLRSAGNVALADFQFKLNYSTDSKILERVIDYGPYSLNDTIDVAGQTIISGTSASDLIKLSDHVLQASLGTLNSGLTVDGTAFNGSEITVPIAALIDAGDGNDIVHASDLGDTVFGGKGQDTLYGGRLDDWLLGGSGDDILDAGSEDVAKLGGDGNYLDGGAGNDILRGREGSDWLEGGDGVDIITGGAGDDVLTGGAGDGDDLKGGAGSDQYLLRLGDGADLAEEEGADAPLSQGAGDAITQRMAAIEVWKANPLGAGAMRPDWLGASTGLQEGTVADGEDAVVFGAGIGMGDIRLQRSGTSGSPGNDLVIQVMHTDAQGVETFSGTQLTVKDWFSNPFKRIEWLKFADGNEIRIGDITSFIVGGAGNDVLIGTEGNDFVYGGAGDDDIFLLAGDDVGNGASGNDMILGDAGKDLLIGGMGNDKLIGGAGSDAISGDAGADDIYGGADRDILSGGRGDGDLVVGGAGDDIFKYARGDGHDMMFDEFAPYWDVIWTEAGKWNTVAGYNRNETTGEVTGPGGAVLYKNYGTADEPDFRWVGRYDYDSATETLKVFNPPAGAVVTANSGTDTIELAPGINLQDVVLRRVDDDLVLLMSNDDADVADYLSVQDSITIKDWYLSPGQIEKLAFYATGLLDISSTGMKLIAGTDGNDGTSTTPLAGTVLADWITAGAGDDVVAGGSGNDIIAGNSGSDTLRGEGGDDVLYGGTGNDILDGGQGKDILIGGSGSDTASYASASAATRIRLSFQSNNTGDAAGDEYSSIENIIGGSGSDNIGGGEGENEITGGAGADMVMGGAGDDTYVWGAADGADTIREGAFVVEEAVNAAGELLSDYTATWTNTGTVSTSGKFYWRLEIRGPGNELVYDYALYSYAAGTAMPAPTTWNIAGWLGGFAKTNGQQVTRDKFDTTISGGNEDTIEFTSGISLTDLTFIRATAGVADANGLDLIISYYGPTTSQITVKDHFTIYGRIETLQFNDGLSVSLASILSATSGGALNGTTGDDLMIGQTGALADSLYGGAGDDVLSGLAGGDQLYGGDGDDVLEGGAGADRLDGGANAADGRGDTVRYVKSAGVTVDLRLATAQSGGDAAGDILVGIENVVGSQTGGDTITGDGNANIIDALDGINIIDGQGGDDVLIGGSSTDTIYGGTGEDNISTGDGNDQAWGGDGDDIIFGGGGDDRLRGDAGNDQIIGGDGNDTILDGGAGDDEIDGGAGNDTLTGGDGNDRLVGGSGTDSLQGGAGDDYYFVQSNDGTDTIIDTHGTNISGFDTAITYDRIWLTQSGSDLKISVIGEDTVITVINFFGTSGAGRIKSIQTSTHAIFLDHPDVLNLIGAMTTASATAPASVPQTVADLQARFWHQGGKAVPIVPSAARAISTNEDTAIAIDGNYGVIDHDNDVSGYQLKDGAGPAKGLISNFNPLTGALTYTPDANANGTDSFIVIVTDAAGHSVELPVSVTIAAVNDAPGTIAVKGGGSLTVAENVPGAVLAAGTLVGEFESVDVEGDALGYTLTGDAGGRFAITGDGKLIVSNPGLINFEAASSHTVTVRVTDNHGAYREQNFIIAVGDANDLNSLPATYNLSVNENVAVGTVVGSVAATDLDQTGAFASQRYYFWDGTAASGTSSDGRYAINVTTGQITVNAALNFEAGNASKTYQVVARDNVGALGFNQAQTAVTIGIVDLNEAPVSLNWSPLVTNVAERDRVGAGTTRPAITLGTLSVTDPDTAGLPSATYSYSLSDSRFEIVGGTLRLKQDAWFDFEAGASVTVTVTGTDGTGTPFTINRAISFNVTDADDISDGTSGADTIVGQSGRDIISGFAGNDTLSGGAGNDSIDGGDGADILYGDAGDDTLLGQIGADTLYGGDGNDTLRGGNDNDRLFGEAGNDSLYGDAGSEGARAAGTEAWRGFSQAGLIGGDGNDLLDGGDGDDYLDGGAGADQLIGGNGFDGVDYSGSNAAVTVNLAAGTGSGGHAQGDTLSGIELVQGSAYGDTITGTSGSDVIYGGAGNDIIYGGAGNDYLFGGDGNDVIDAQAGDDVLDGGAGDDILNGGIDNDLYIVTRSSGADTINNYDPSGDDVDVIGFNDSGGVINDQDLWFERIGNDLKIMVIGTGASVQITDWYVVADPNSRANHQIDFIVANTSYSRTINIEGLVTLMATKTKPTTVAARDTLMGDLNYKAMWATYWNSNATPTLSAITQQSTNEDVAKQISVTATDDITPGTQIQLSAQVISGTNVVTNAGISFGVPNASGVRTMTINPVANASGTARIRVTATDAGGISSTQEFDIVVNGVADTPTITQFTSAGGTSGGTGIALALNASFPDSDGSETHELWITGVPSGVTLSAGTYDGASATWRLTKAQLSGLRIMAPAGWSADLGLTATARATENGQTAISAAVVLNVLVNAPPTGASFSGSANENAGNGTAVGTVTGNDPDGDSLTYSLVDSAGGRFAISTTGAVSVANGTLLNFETATSHSITVRITDVRGEYIDRSFAIAVNNVNEANSLPASYSLSVNENVAVGTVVGTVAASDLDSASVAYGQQRYFFWNGSTATGTSADGRYAINATTGQITVNSALNFEAGTTSVAYTVIARDYAGSAGYMQAQTSVTIAINNLNEANSIPASYSFAVNENVGIGSAVGSVAASDPDGSSVTFGQQRYYFWNGSAASATSSDGRYSIDAVTGQIKTAAAPNFEAGSTSGTYTVIARDNAGTGSYNQVQSSVTIGINNLNEANSLPSSYSFAVNENVGVGTAVGTVVASDIDSSGITFGQQRYYFWNGSAASATSSDGRYSINATTGLITTAAGLNYEAGSPSVAYTVIARDNAGTGPYNQVQSSVTIGIQDVNEPHSLSAASFTINESNNALGPLVAINNSSGTPVNLNSMLIDPENRAMRWQFDNGTTTNGAWQIEQDGTIRMIQGRDYEEMTKVYGWVDQYEYDPYTGEQYYTGQVWQWTGARDTNLATQTLNVQAIDDSTGLVKTAGLTLTIANVNEKPTISSSVGYLATDYDKNGAVYKKSATEYWVTANRDGGPVIQILPSDPDGTYSFTYSLSNVQAPIEVIGTYGGDSEIEATAYPYLSIDSQGRVNFYTPGEEYGEWEGGVKIGGTRRRSSVTINFSVNVTDAGGLTATENFKIVFTRRDTAAPPIVFDLDGDGLELVASETSTIEFDMDGDGVRDETGWVGADDGFLALDRNGNGLIDDITEISFISDAEGASSDLEGLRSYDTDGDGYFDADDAEFGRFLIWRDADQDGISQASEIKTLGEWGIRAINLSMTLTGQQPDQGGNVVYATTDYEKTDGGSGTVGDVMLGFTPSDIEDIGAPVVLDFDGDGKTLTEMADNQVRFDMTSDGIADKTGWIDQGDAFLALDRNGNGKIDDLSEISFVNDHPDAETDLEGLAAYDSNGDGVLNGDDARFAEFRLWFDTNSNGVTDAGELLSLAQAGVVSISLDGTATGASAASGKNIVFNTGSFMRANGETGNLIDAGLAFKALTAFPEIEYRTSNWEGSSKRYRLNASAGTVRVVPRMAEGPLAAEAGQIADAGLLTFGNRSFGILSTILLDLDGDGLESKSAKKSKARFDMNGDGIGDDTGWMSGGDGMLVIDRDKDGLITDASELSFLSEKEGAKNSWEGLAALDNNKDGKLDKTDTRFGELKVWTDRNGDGISQAEEIRTLADLGIAEIGLRNLATSDTVKVGRNLALSTATFKRENGTTATIGNVALGFEEGKVGRPIHVAPEGGPLVVPVDTLRAASNLAEAMSRFGINSAGDGLRNLPNDGMAPHDWFAAAVA